MRGRLNFFFYDLRSRWQTFTYNFGWPDYVVLFDGWLPKASMAAPFIGYLIIFNDGISQHLSFERLAEEASNNVGFLSGSVRLQLVYFGLLILGAANLIYYARRPYAIKLGSDQFEYMTRGLQHFTLADYQRLHGMIRHNGMDPRTHHGKYSDKEFRRFTEAASGSGASHWLDAKSKHEDLLRSILIEVFFRQKTSRRKSLITCIALAIFGYSLLLVPSADLFIKVMAVVLRGIV